MKLKPPHLVAALAAIFVCACVTKADAPAADPDPLTFTLTADEAAQCEAGGGCFVITRKNFGKALREYAQHELEACRNAT